MAFTETIDPAAPLDTALVQQGAEEFRNLKQAVVERLESVFTDIDVDPMKLKNGIHADGAMTVEGILTVDTSLSVSGDIGSSTGSISAGLNLTAAATGAIGWSGRASLTSPSSSAISTAAIISMGGVVVPTSTPASASATGVAGTITWDANFIYICVATNTWKRVAIATW